METKSVAVASLAAKKQQSPDPGTLFATNVFDKKNPPQ
jgi:hypothetical protein